jgi:hypothetical protein
MKCIYRELEKRVTQATRRFPAVVLTGPRRAVVGVAGFRPPALNLSSTLVRVRDSLAKPNTSTEDCHASPEP